MKQLFFYLVTIILVSLYIASPTINFKPFSVSFEKPINGIGFFFFSIGLVLMLTGYHVYGHREGYQKCHQETLNMIKDTTKK